MKVIHVLRKPCSEGTVAANVLKHGTGALNIDASRVAHDASVDMDAVQRQQATGGNSSVKGAFGAEALVGKEIAMYKPGGRWPANLVLQHLDGCRQDGTKEVRVVGCTAKTPHTDRGMMLNGSERTSMVHYATKGRETVANWTCEPGCPVAALDEQSGPTGSWSPKSRPSGEEHAGNPFGRRQEGSHYGDFGGGASRFFKQVKA